MSCNCKKSFEDYVIGSPEFVQVNALLAASTAYVWELTDSFGNIYHIGFTTDVNGIGSIDMSELPDGFANSSQAPVQIRIKASPTDCDYIPLVLVQRFLQIKMSFKSGSATKDWLACPIGAPDDTDRVYSSSYSDDYN